MAADRAINLALRVVGIGEVERDFRRAGEAGEQSFEKVEKAANGADRAVSEYTARLRRVTGAAKAAFDRNPEVQAARLIDPAGYRPARDKFVLDAISAEKELMRRGLGESTSGLNDLWQASDGAGGSLGRVAALSAAAGTALVALGKITMDSVLAFRDHEQAVNAFHAELSLAGNRSAATADEIENMARRIGDAMNRSDTEVLEAARTLASVSGITSEAMAAALEASEKFADATGRELPDVIENVTAPVLRALADRDMKALIAATEDLDRATRIEILTLAESGRQADATRVLLEKLTTSAGSGSGLTAVTDKLTDAWDRFKKSMGQDMAPYVVPFLDNFANKLDELRNKADAANVSIVRMLYLKATNRELYDAVPTNRREGYGPGVVGTFLGQTTGAVSDAFGQARVAMDAYNQGRIEAIEARYDKKDKPASAGASNTAGVGDMVALIKDLFPGARITSTIRKGDKGSDHSVGRAIDFVPAGGMGSISTDEVRQRLLDAGVDIRRNARGTEQFFGPGRHAARPGDHDDHFHVAWQGSPSPERAAAIAQRAQDARQREGEQARGAADRVLEANEEVIASYALRASEAEEKVGLEGAALEAVERRHAIEASARRINLEMIEKEVAARRAEAALAGRSFDEAAAVREVTAAVADQQGEVRDLAARYVDAEAAMAAFNRRQEQAAAILDELKSPLDRINERIEAAIDALKGSHITVQQFDDYMKLLAEDIGEVTRQLDDSARAWEGFGQDVGRTFSDIIMNGGSARDILQQLIRLPLDRLMYQNVEMPIARWIDGLTGNDREKNAAKALGGLPQGRRIAGASVEVLDASAGAAAGSVTQLGAQADMAAGSLSRIPLALNDPMAELAGSTDAARNAMGELVPVTGQFQGALGQLIASLSGAGGGGGGGFLGTLFSLGSMALGAAGGGGGGAAGAALGRGDPLSLGTIARAPFPGFAGGTTEVPVSKPFFVGENGVETMRYHGGGRLEVISGPQTRRMMDQGGGLTIIQNNHIPSLTDARRTQSGIQRANQRAWTTAARKGLAMAGGR